MREPYFIYTSGAAGAQVTRDEAVRAVRARDTVMVALKPSATPVIVTISNCGSLVGQPKVEITGWGYQEPVIAKRYGMALVEAARITDDAAWREPEWLHERNNDPYGTPRTHEFWATVTWARQGDYKYFRRDGWWFAYDFRHNAWYHFDTAEACWDHTHKPAIDPWA